MGKTATKKRNLGADLQHKQGCPEDPERVEKFPQQRPDRSWVEITRCQDCAAQTVAAIDEPEGDT